MMTHGPLAVLASILNHFLDRIIITSPIVVGIAIISNKIFIELVSEVIVGYEIPDI
jgi:hypothetical protein